MNVCFLIKMISTEINWEAQQEQKHEYLKCEVFAIGGTRREHVVVSGNIYSGLKIQLRNKPCMAYIADMKLLVEQADAFFIRML